MKKFTKNDKGFKCVHCGGVVPPLVSSSRDHCNLCLHGLHVDINPGDRANICCGVLKPVNVTPDARKGYVIHYTCKSCGTHINNKSAHDDNFEEIIKICKTHQPL